MIKYLRDFWEQDIINKLIVIVSLLLVGVFFAFVYLLTNLPDGKSLRGAIAQLFPSALRSEVDPTPIITAEWTATPTAFNLAPLVTPASPTNQPTPTPVPVLETATPALDLTAFSPTVDLLTATSSVGVPPVVTIDQNCIPDHPVQIGRVVEVNDGITIKVMIEGLVYVVRYIGVVTPKEEYMGRAATQLNSMLVYGRDVNLVADVSDRDENGRLLRYVVVGDKFVNLELIAQKLGSAVDVPPDSACAQIFKQAEQLP